ncbi:hypothetical protein [Devosia sp.]|uniref:hypothetical protein n=1 Tax=Devosia sp. TaxID=1871048 RepID=UPI003BA8CC46
MIEVRRAALAIALLLMTAAPALRAEEVVLLVPHTGSDTKPAGTVDPAKVMPSQPALTGSSGGGSYDADEPPSLQTRHFGTQVALVCAPAGQPGGLELTNAGDTPLEPGTKIKWQFKNSKFRGYFALIGALAPGATMVADGVISGTPPAGAGCVARSI